MSGLAGKKVAVIGVGKLGEAILGGALKAGALDAANVVVTARRASRAAEMAEKYGCRAGTDNPAAAAGADVVLLAVKPFNIHDVCHEIRDAVRPGQVVISVAAGVSTEAMERVLPPDVAVIRAMPNTPCLLNAGATALAAGSHASDADLDLADEIFRAVGRCVRLDEKHMDAVTGLSASGPAFIYVVIESMAEAGVKVGLPRDVATELAAQAVFGSAKMVLETGEHPALLKDLVTTPAGCTVDGLLELEAGGLRVTLIKAIVEATRRAAELQDG